MSEQNAMINRIFFKAALFGFKMAKDGLTLRELKSELAKMIVSSDYKILKEKV